MKVHSGDGDSGSCDSVNNSNSGANRKRKRRQRCHIDDTCDEVVVGEKSVLSSISIDERLPSMEEALLLGMKAVISRSS